MSGSRLGGRFCRGARSCLGSAALSRASSLGFARGDFGWGLDATRRRGNVSPSRGSLFRRVSGVRASGPRGLARTTRKFLSDHCAGEAKSRVSSRFPTLGGDEPLPVRLVWPCARSLQVSRRANCRVPAKAFWSGNGQNRSVRDFDYER